MKRYNLLINGDTTTEILTEETVYVGDNIVSICKDENGNQFEVLGIVTDILIEESLC